MYITEIPDSEMGQGTGGEPSENGDKGAGVESSGKMVMAMVLVLILLYKWRWHKVLVLNLLEKW